MEHKEFLSKIDHDRIVAAIRGAEQQTSGEIRVHVSRRAGADIRPFAERTFERLGMTKTAERNGVLLFIATELHQFVILGDKGIDEKVPAGFWDDIASKLTERFKSGDFTNGIVEAINAAGEHLGKYFPRSAADTNELPDEISTD
ncbi:MAG TPA: TPM domain-containing protein [Thermoanaerobaculia bacterium]|nr:TPM domain-containing protein [Thermoanaerobaculia bacterium]